MISAKIIEDSVSPVGVRLTTLQLCYHRFFHSEFMTHRVFSRNASSSRAIPVAKMIKQVRENPAMPIHWGKNQSGMQARMELPYDDIPHAKELWLQAAEQAAATAEQMISLGLHKQVINRILEPFQWIHVIVTGTEWDNFFELRYHEDAQPEIFELAKQIRWAMDNSIPKNLSYGEWHLPYVSFFERTELPVAICKKLSAARCARVSYLNHDGTNPDFDKDISLHDSLVLSRPQHSSPVEHQATPVPDSAFHKNFRGWKQYRFEVEASVSK